MSEHTQDCIDAFYGDGGQSGCICGADDEVLHPPQHCECGRELPCFEHQPEFDR